MKRPADGVRRTPLKVFATRIGLDEVAVAASSQKAALAAFGVHADLFAQGTAAITHDADLVARALANPGEPIRRRIRVSDVTFARKTPKPAKKAEPRAREHKAPTRDLENAREARAKMRAAESARAKEAAEAAEREAREAIAEARAALKAFDKEAKAELSALEDERHTLDVKEARVKTGLAARRKRLEAALKHAQDS